MTRKGLSFSGACAFAWQSTQAQSQTSGWVLWMFERHVPLHSDAWLPCQHPFLFAWRPAVLVLALQSHSLTSCLCPAHLTPMCC